MGLITEDPSQAFDVMDKIASQAAAQQIGTPDDKTASGELDPIVNFAMN